MTVSFITSTLLSNGTLIVSALGGLTGLVALIINFIKHNKYRVDNEQARVIRWLENKLREKDSKLDSMTINYDLLEKKYYDQVRIVTLLESSSFNVPFSYWLKNTNYEIDYINRYYEKEFNVKMSDVVGRTDYDFWSKEVADKYRETDKQVLEGSDDVIIDVDNEVDSYLVLKWKRYSNNIVIGVAGLAIKIDEENKNKLIELMKKRD